VITRVSKVIVPITDQQAALDFWTTGMGFELVRDDSYGNERWIEVQPPDQDLLLVLSPRQADEPRRAVPDRLPHSDLFFDCADIESTYAELTARGVKFPLPPAVNTLAGGPCSRTTTAHGTRSASRATPSTWWISTTPDRTC
jgi:catechol 2,3-dioxygenase-like lactoylglutathione lyase family enzyme